MTKSAEKIKTELSLLSQQERAELAYFLIRSLRTKCLLKYERSTREAGYHPQ